MDGLTIPHPVECPQCHGDTDALLEHAADGTPKLTRYCPRCGPCLPRETRSIRPTVNDNGVVRA